MVSTRPSHSPWKLPLRLLESWSEHRRRISVAEWLLGLLGTRTRSRWRIRRRIGASYRGCASGRRPRAQGFSQSWINAGELVLRQDAGHDRCRTACCQARLVWAPGEGFAWAAVDRKRDAPRCGSISGTCSFCGDTWTYIQRLLLHPKRRQSFYERKTATWYVQVIYMRWFNLLR